MIKRCVEIPQVIMSSDYNFPPKVEMPMFLRRMKFVFQPFEYLEQNAQIYGDTFSQPQKEGTSTVN